jgi:hypothetical protein
MILSLKRRESRSSPNLFAQLIGYLFLDFILHDYYINLDLILKRNASMLKILCAILLFAKTINLFASFDSATTNLEERFEKIKASALEGNNWVPYLAYEGQEVIYRPLEVAHASVIFGGSSQSSGREFGIGDAAHYTVNIPNAFDPNNGDDPDYCADMNSSLGAFPDARFDTVIAANIPVQCFKWKFFLNAYRILKPGGVLISSTFWCFCGHWDERSDSIKEIGDNLKKFENLLKEICFVSIREELPGYKAQLESIGFCAEQFPFEDSTDPYPYIFRKTG